MNKDNVVPEQTSAIHLAFDPSRLEALIREGKLHVADFHCLNKPSQQIVWSVLRSVTVNNLRLL